MFYPIFLAYVSVYLNDNIFKIFFQRFYYKPLLIVFNVFHH